MIFKFKANGIKMGPQATNEIVKDLKLSQEQKQKKSGCCQIIFFENFKLISNLFAVYIIEEIIFSDVCLYNYFFAMRFDHLPYQIN